MRDLKKNPKHYLLEAPQLKIAVFQQWNIKTFLPTFAVKMQLLTLYLIRMQNMRNQ